MTFLCVLCDKAGADHGHTKSTRRGDVELGNAISRYTVEKNLSQNRNSLPPKTPLDCSKSCYCEKIQVHHKDRYLETSDRKSLS